MCSLTSKIRLLAQNINKINTVRYSSYRSSPLIKDLQDTLQVQYEVTKDPVEWKYVERLLKPQVVPEPVIKEKYASDWKPQNSKLQNKNYFISRTKNHMMPVYLEITQRGMRKITMIKKIEGDIWLLEKHLKDFLQKHQEKEISTQVNEFVGYIRIHGDHVNAIKYYLEKHGY